jgi:hypothetical protein
MADKKISELTILPQASDDDLLAIVDNADSETKQITRSAFMASPGNIGTGLPGSAEFTTLQLTGGAIINNISTNVNLGNSNTTVPTQRAVKEYVDAQLLPLNVRRIDSDTTAVASDILLVDTTNGNVTIEMLDISNGKIDIKKVSGDSNSVIINAPSLIDGQAQITIITQFQSYNILVDSGEFFVI